MFNSALASMDPKKILDQIVGASDQYKVYQRIYSGCYAAMLRMFYSLHTPSNDEIGRAISLLLDVKHWMSNISLPHPSLVQQGNYLSAAPCLTELSLYETREKCDDGNK
jgi:hypothetical protein